MNIDPRLVSAGVTFTALMPMFSELVRRIHAIMDRGIAAEDCVALVVADAGVAVATRAGIVEFMRRNGESHLAELIDGCRSNPDEIAIIFSFDRVVAISANPYDLFGRLLVGNTDALN